MANKYLTIDLTTGKKVLTEATTVSTGTAEAGKIVALDSTGKLDSTLLPTGIGAETIAVVASEDLSAGDLVNIYDNAGTPNVRKADAASGFPADGFVLTATLTGGTATVYTDGINNQLASLTVVGTCYLGAAGAVTQTVPTTGLYQVVGKAVSATEMVFERNQVVQL